MSPTAAAEAFERAPLLAGRIVDGAPDTVIAQARDLLAGMTETERIAVLDAHPRIGATRDLSARSAAEQRAGEATDPATLAALAELNEAYERKFGFRCVVFVQGRSRAEIVPILRARVERRRDQELATGIEEFLAIARDRLTRG